MTKCRICDARVPADAKLCPSCGAPVSSSGPTVSAEVEQELLQLLDAGKDSEAVARYREATGAPLSDARQAVEQLGKASAAPTDLDAGLQKELLDLIGAGQKIQAIKVYRETVSCGLAEAKDVVEALAAKHGVTSQGGGCATVLAVLLTVVASAIFLTA